MVMGGEKKEKGKVEPVCRKRKREKEKVGEEVDES